MLRAELTLYAATELTSGDFGLRSRWWCGRGFLDAWDSGFGPEARACGGFTDVKGGRMNAVLWANGREGVGWTRSERRFWRNELRLEWKVRLQAILVGNSAESGSGIGMAHILLVEDEPAIADIMVYALESEHFRVSHELTGAAGLELAAVEPPDLALVDLGLPDMSGFELCRRLRERGSLPVVFLTARGAEMDRVLGLELGGDDYVTKPFSPREVVARVRAVLRRTGLRERGQTNASGGCSESGGAALGHCAEAMRMTLRGQVLDLTAHEYRLLKTLQGQPGRVFTRDQLLELAWADPGAVTDRTVDAHVKSIRAKLRALESGAEGWIETRRGLGYSLRAVEPRAE